MDITQIIIDYISKITRIGKDELDKDTEIYSSHILSSINMLELITFLGTKLCIQMEMGDFREEYFENIGTLADYYQSRLKEKTVVH